MELKIPIEVDFDDLKSLLDDLGKIQKYKLFEGDKMVLVDVDDVADVLTRHIKAKEKQPERKTGEWIYNSPVTMKCNQCGLVIKDWDWNRFKYCPNCCSDMRGERE